MTLSHKGIVCPRLARWRAASLLVWLVLLAGGAGAQDVTLGDAPEREESQDRNRADANHRYMTLRSLRDEMVVRGWLAEGDGLDLVVMCVPQ